MSERPTASEPGDSRFERPLILGIETSCDDTACALVDGVGRMLASAVSSQITAHRPYGGVAANRLLRRELAAWARRREVDLRLVPLAFSGDNAAMIAFAALVRQRRGVAGDPRDLVPASRIPFADALTSEGAR